MVALYRSPRLWSRTLALEKERTNKNSKGSEWDRERGVIGDQMAEHSDRSKRLVETVKGNEDSEW